MKPVRVLLVEDHALVRAGLKALLQEIPDVEIVGEAADGHEAIHLATRLQPHVVLMDIAMPGLNGLEAAARLRRTHPHIRVLIVSMHALEEYVHRALAAGAAGYLLKNADRGELELALRSVTRGDTYLSPGISKTVVAAVVQGGKTARGATLDALSPRQREVLQLIAEGHTTKAIAQRLALGIKTVETHRAQLMKRLGIHDVPGLVRYAIRQGLVSVEG